MNRVDHARHGGQRELLEVFRVGHVHVEAQLGRALSPSRLNLRLGERCSGSRAPLTVSSTCVSKKKRKKGDGEHQFPAWVGGLVASPLVFFILITVFPVT